MGLCVYCFNRGSGAQQHANTFAAISPGLEKVNVTNHADHFMTFYRYDVLASMIEEQDIDDSKLGSKLIEKLHLQKLCTNERKLACHL